MHTLADIRETFTDFFKKHGHTEVRSSLLVPQNDPTLLFTNAGMVQFKDVFTGKEKRPYQRAVTAQKCLRAGGKHNDLENVGYTARHHTFFEMLGNFSFGNYFKEQAIEYAWNLVTKGFCLNPKKLLVTVYAEDEEAAKLWRKITGIEESRIIKIATTDNFWSMGDTGPCGPCSEIFYDHGENIAGGPPGSADQDGDRFIEIWNLVFMQFDQQPDGSRTLLPTPSVDTGMGLERMAAVVQSVHNNYDIDLFKTLILVSQELTKADRKEHKQSHNVIADHIRACSFLIADGVMPSNEGRGYVLRRIMRRAMRHAHKLGTPEPLMHLLVPTLVSLMGNAYPELNRAQSLVKQILYQEEEKFRQTLERGLKLLQESTYGLATNQPLAGDIAFKLYDTYGFPLDLTQDVLRTEGRVVDIAGFEKSMQEQKQKARDAWRGSGDITNEKIWFDYHEKFGSTEFLGYSTTESEAVIQALIAEGQNYDIFSEVNQPVFILTNQTPFYAESGGQIGDQGILTSNEGKTIVKIQETIKKIGNIFVHVGYLEKGDLRLGQIVKLEVHKERRRQLAANHSATHLLHAVLKKILGDHVIQKGSLVAPDRLRFDFTHLQALTEEELNKVEQMVNNKILINDVTKTRLMTPDQAIQQGAMALFGEKYGEEVRVVSMGQDSFSVELCGGTHVQQLGDIGLFKIVSENSVSAGIRRIEAITGTAIIDLLNSTQNNLVQEREQSRKQLIDLQKQLAETRRQVILQSGSTKHDSTETTNLGGHKAVIKHLENVPPRDLKTLVDRYKQEIKSGIVVMTSVSDGTVTLVIGITNDLTDRLNAILLAKAGAKILGGQGGGGRPDLAQAGGPHKENIDKIIQAISEAL